MVDNGSVWDQQLVARLHEAAVPAEVEQRILARLRQASAAAPTAAPLTRGSGVRRVVRRRAWLFAALAASVALGFVGWRYWPRATGTLDLASLAREWTSLVDESKWLQSAPPAAFSLPASMTATIVSWQQLDRAVGKGIVALLSSRGTRATTMLFMVARPRSGLPPRPPALPDSTTSGLAVGAWWSQKHIHLLVVHGDQQAYRSFFQANQLAAR